MQITSTVHRSHMRRLTLRRTARIVPKPLSCSFEKAAVPAIRATVLPRVMFPLTPHRQDADPGPGARCVIGGLPVFFSMKREV